MTITELVQQAHRNARSKGFHDEPTSLPTGIALIHSELSEALEAHRNGNIMELVDKMRMKNFVECIQGEDIEQDCQDCIDNCFLDYKDSMEIELADAVIRIADLCGLLEIDLESCIKAKMIYNKTRPRLHGKSY